MEKQKVEKKRGNKAGIAFFKFTLKCLGLPFAYAFLYFVCLYYLLFDKDAFLRAEPYIKRRFKTNNFFKLSVATYKLFVSQGKQLIDRMAALNGYPGFKFDLAGKDNMYMLRDCEQGCILLTAHFGNWQLALTTLGKLEKKVYLVMHKEANDAIKKALDVCGGGENIEVISPDEYLGGIIPIMNALKQGHIVSFMGDRAYGADSLAVDFMGDKAYFPYGPFNIAASAKVPVMALMVAKTAHKGYELCTEHVYYPEYKSRRNKKEQLLVWVQQYADLINIYAERFPYQCFLFYDVWKDSINDV